MNVSPSAARDLLLCVAVLFLGVALSSAAASQPQQPDSDWMGKAFAAAFDDFFPIQHGEGDFIAVRAHRDGTNDLPEFSIVLDDTQGALTIHAILREAQGSSLYQQLEALHAREPSKSYAELKPELKIRTWNLAAGQCPAIAAQLKAFNNIQFVRPRDDDPIAEHPILYQFHESVDGGDSEVTEFVETRAFPQWANETHHALDACAASAPGN
ncbi:MAG TPA: hypothetical protein VFM21_05245 [Terriglobia bacterium]|nr:hypothetical protein [Terriglobia bacterium]